MAELFLEKDLIKAVSLDLGMEEKKIENHLIFFKHFLDLTITNDEIHSIQLPHVGTMYRNVKGCAHMNTYIKGVGLEEKHKSKMEKNEKDIKFILNKLSSFENISLHNTKRRIHNPYFTCILNKKELEEFQNR